MAAKWVSVLGRHNDQTSPFYWKALTTMATKGATLNVGGTKTEITRTSTSRYEKDSMRRAKTSVVSTEPHRGSAMRRDSKAKKGRWTSPGHETWKVAIAQTQYRRRYFRPS